MPSTPFAEFAPDQPPIGGWTRHVLNVLPKTKSSYGPVYATDERGTSLVDTCQGAAAFRSTADGTAVNFAGDLTNLYLADSAFTWSDVSGATYSTPTDGGWEFSQFNNTVIATNGVDNMQQWSIGTSAAFASMVSASASTDAAPIARYIAVVKDFLMAANLSTNRAAVRWSEQFNYKSWRIGTNQSDDQDLPDNGAVTGVAGGQYGVVFQQHGINLLTYTGDPAIVFQRDLVADDRGCMAPGSLASIERTSFFWDADGFYRIDNGQTISPIGSQRVDITFRQDVNRAFLHKIRSAIDHDNKIYYVSYASSASVLGVPDSILAYNFDPSVDRWAKLNFGVDILWNMFAAQGTTLEALDAIYPSIDAMGPSLDSELFQSSPVKTFAAFTSNKKLAFFEGDVLEWVIDTVEAETNPFGQAEIDRIIPYVDGGTISALLGHRNRLNDAITFSPVSTQDQFGDIYFREPAARFHRARVTGTGDFTHAQGIEFQPVPAGDR
ncbi:MAG: hypothetical protein AAAC47_08665 [Pararhizobium sp.]